MKTVRIIGVGMGPDTVTVEGLRALRDAEVLLGAGRLTEAFPELNKPVLAGYAPDAVASAVRASEKSRFAVLVSGDVGFYSAAQGLVRALDFCEVELIPGVSSVSFFFARLKLPWQDAAVVSCHGRACNLADTVRRNRFTFALTGGNVPQLADGLVQAGFGALSAAVGENLGGKNERIFSASVSELGTRETDPLTVLLVENPQPDGSSPTGIPDERFFRGDVPMTKSEVRAVILSKLRLSPESVCADIGAGTGSVTAEMALAAWKGRVYAVDRNEEAMTLIRKNCAGFHIGNVIPVQGDAPQALEELPPVDAAFIGGSGGKMREIVSSILLKNPAARIVASAIALESVGAAVQAFSAAGLTPEIVQLGVSRTREAGGMHLLMAQNPIFIISGGGCDGR